MEREGLAYEIAIVARDEGWPVPQAVALAVADKVTALFGDERAEARARRNAPETSHQVMEKIRDGSLGEELLKHFMVHRIIGFTDEELEHTVGRSHQSVSAARNTLVRKGYVTATERRRWTQSGNPAVVWVWTGKERVA